MTGKTGTLLIVMFCMAVLFCAAGAAPVGAAGGQAVFFGKVSDVEGHAVEGAMVFLYAGGEVRRSAEFISARTDIDGRFRMVLPPGRYLSIARFKKAEGYGPLMQGDKHSGEPTEVKLEADKETEMDFVVADLKDALQTRTKARERALKVSGRIVDEKGAPVAGVYAFAVRNERFSGVPDHVSLWTDQEGRYTLYVPRGRYFLGTASAFPPGQAYSLQGAMNIEGDNAVMDIVRKPREAMK